MAFRRRLRLARIARVENAPRLPAYSPEEWRDIQANLVDAEVQALESGLVHARQNPRMRRQVPEIEARLSNIRGRYLHTYTIRVNLVDRVNGDGRWVTLTFNVNAPERSARFEASMTRYLRSDEYNERFGDGEGYINLREDVSRYVIVRRDNIAVNRGLISIARLPGFASELSVMNVQGRVQAIVLGFERMCGYLLIQEDLNLTPATVEAMLNKNRHDGLTPEDMKAVFVNQDAGLIVADTHGEEIVRHSLPQTVRGADRAPTVYAFAGAHWSRPSEDFADRVRRSRNCDHIALTSASDEKEPARVDVIPVESLAEALNMESDRKDGERMSPLVFNAEQARRRQELAEWIRASAVPFTGSARARQPAHAIEAWKQSKAEQRRLFKEWSIAHKPAPRAERPARRKYYLKNADDLSPVWASEIAEKRLYDRTKHDGNKIVSFSINQYSALTIDDGTEVRRRTYEELWPGAGTFSGQSWAGIAGHYVAELFKKAGIPQPASTPNDLVKLAIGTESVGGIYIGNGDRPPRKWKVHAVDVRRQYANILRKGGFYTVDIVHELRALNSTADLVDEKGDIRTDRIYRINTAEGTYARHVLGSGLVDYDLVQAYADHVGGWHKVWPLVGAYLPVAHQPEADEVYRAFVDSIYSRVSDDGAKKRIVNFAVGLLVSGGMRKKYKIYHTDDKDTAHFHFNTMNTPTASKRLTSSADYVNQAGERVPVYTVKGATVSQNLSTQILQNRAIVQRGRAQMIRAMTHLRQTAHHLISVKVDCITYATESDAPFFSVSEAPALGEWRPCEPIACPSSTPTYDPTVVAEQTAQGEERTMRYRALIQSVAEWNSEEFNDITPHDIVGNLSLISEKKRERTPDETRQLIKEHYQRVAGDFPISLLQALGDELREKGEPVPEAYERWTPPPLDANEPRNMRCLIIGSAGTGKSHLASGVADLLKARGFRVFRSAYTYCASEIVDGQTLHSTLSMSINGASTSVGISRILANYDAGIIDEVSMLDERIWRVLSYIPHDFPLYLFGDFGQLRPPVSSQFMASHSQALMSICNNRRVVLTKQWRSNPDYVSQVQQLSADMAKATPDEKDAVELPAGVRCGANLTIAEEARALNIFRFNRPRADKNREIVCHLASEQKDAVHIPDHSRTLVGDFDYIEYPDMAQLADIMRNSQSASERHLLNAYLGRARQYGKDRLWGVGVKYIDSACGRIFADGNVGIQKMSRATRARACRGYLDVDFINCGMSILQQLMAKHACPCPGVEDYNGNREEHLKALIGSEPRAEYMGGRTPPIRDRDGAKLAVICVMNGAPVKHNSYILETIAEDVARLCVILAKGQHYTEWLLDKIGAVMKKEGMTSEKVAHTVSTCRTEYKVAEVRGMYDYPYALEHGTYMHAYLSSVIYRAESRALSAMVSYVKQKFKTVSAVLAHDGAMFHGLTPADLSVDEIAAAVYEATQLRLGVSFKAIHDGSALPAVEPFSGYSPRPCTAEGCHCLSSIEYDEYPAVFEGLTVVMTQTRAFGARRALVKLTNNSAHTISKVENGEVELTSARNGKSVRMSFAELAKYSRPSYCRTDYKVQGISHKATVIIHQFYDKRADGQYLLSKHSRYVSMTRATAPEMVYVK